MRMGPLFTEAAMMRAYSFVGLVVAIYVLSIADALAQIAVGGGCTEGAVCVPEPASLALLAVGLGAFAVARLRQKK